MTIAQEKLNELLAELYQLDPSLRRYEKELLAIMKKLLAAKPAVELDPTFKNQLQAQLLAQIEKIKQQKQTNNFFTNFNFMNPKIAYSGWAALALLLLVLPAVYWFGPNNHLPFGGSLTQLGFGATPSFAALADNAFGQLNSQEVALATGRGAGPAATGQDLNAEIATAPTVDTAVADSGSGGGKVASSLIWPGAANYQLVYQGEPLELSQEQLTVYRRVKTSSAGKNLASLISGADFGLLNLSRLKNAEVQNITLAENRDQGYSAYIDFNEGAVSLSQNWNKWLATPAAGCASDGTGCVIEPLKESDVPGDQSLFALAANFINNYQINLSAYGQPQIDKSWQVLYASARERGETGYVPDSLSIVYPLTLQGQTVYDQSGNLYGLRVNIDLRQNQVTGLWGLTTQNYEASTYAAETDPAAIIAAAEQGGLNPIYRDPAAATQEIKLGTPQQTLILMYRYQNNQNEELIVPALIFPVVEKPADAYYFQNQIVVPLVKELLSQNTADQPIRIMEKSL